MAEESSGEQTSVYTKEKLDKEFQKLFIQTQAENDPTIRIGHIINSIRGAFTGFLQLGRITETQRQELEHYLRAKVAEQWPDVNFDDFNNKGRGISFNPDSPRRKE
jgi:hypothetical protein